VCALDASGYPIGFNIRARACSKQFHTLASHEGVGFKCVCASVGSQAKSLRVVVAALKEKSANDDTLIKVLQESGSGNLSKRLSLKSSLGTAGATAGQALAGTDGEAALEAQIQILQDRVKDRDQRIKEQEVTVLELTARLQETALASQQPSLQKRPSGIPVLVDAVDG
jgi:hypothetical protein